MYPKFKFWSHGWTFYQNLFLFGRTSVMWSTLRSYRVELICKIVYTKQRVLPCIILRKIVTLHNIFVFCHLDSIFSNHFRMFRLNKCNWKKIWVVRAYLIITISESFSLGSTRICDLNKLQTVLREPVFTSISFDVFLLLYVELPNGTVKLISAVYMHWPNCKNVSNSTYHTRFHNFSKVTATDPVKITINYDTHTPRFYRSKKK